MSKYFKCNPNTLCDGGVCCKTVETQPGLTLGDFYRISKKTGTTVPDLWRNHGIVNLTYEGKSKNGNNGLYAMTLGLFHDPCPYLNKKARCDIYDARPVRCATFPFQLLEKGDSGELSFFSKYRCMKTPISRSQKSKSRQSNVITKKEFAIDNKLFWTKGLITLEVEVGSHWVIKSIGDVGKKVMENNPKFLDSSKGEKFIEFSKKVIDADERKVQLTLEDTKKFLQYFYTALFDNAIYSQMCRIESRLASEYKETTKEYENILKK